MSASWTRWLEASLAELDDRELLRDLDALEPESAVHVRRDGRRLTLFSSNDYLGLSYDDRIRRAAADAARDEGMGPRGSPLICGYTDRHRALERELSELKGTESTLLFPTGFAANLGVMASLAGPDTAIFSDELNHASIIDGCRLARRSGAELQVYDHADPESLDEEMRASDAERKVVVTDSVFSMDGELAPLDAIADVKASHGALLVVDEAHATLVFGADGAGVARELGVSGAVDVNVGTMSKAFGTLGGFASTSERMRRWLLNRGRSYIYSTAPPLPIVEAARMAVDVGGGDCKLRDRLWRHVDRLGEHLGRDLTSPIVPVVLGDEERALRASERLLEEGIHATAIRPPTVPEGTSRIRVTLSAAHTEDDIDHLAQCLESLVE
ncbi:MAG: aminotransferase class I/II-fold pyridoxal phosphate-dependent enzyme [Bradymonadaceae bacterium]